MTANGRKKKPVAPATRDIDIIYQENILDHYRRPRNFGRIAGASASRKEANFSCGDDVEIFILFGTDGRTKEVKFEGRGCAVSQAAASLLTEQAIGLTRKQLAALSAGDVVAWLGIPIGPSRLRCATLALKALQNALAGDDKV